jgi:hypothetical protein
MSVPSSSGQKTAVFGPLSAPRPHKGAVQTRSTVGEREGRVSAGGAGARTVGSMSINLRNSGRLFQTFFTCHDLRCEMPRRLRGRPRSPSHSPARSPSLSRALSHSRSRSLPLSAWVGRTCAASRGSGPRDRPPAAPPRPLAAQHKPFQQYVRRAGNRPAGPQSEAVRKGSRVCRAALRRRSTKRVGPGRIAGPSLVLSSAEVSARRYG